MQRQRPDQYILSCYLRCRCLLWPALLQSRDGTSSPHLLISSPSALLCSALLLCLCPALLSAISTVSRRQNSPPPPSSISCARANRPSLVCISRLQASAATTSAMLHPPHQASPFPHPRAGRAPGPHRPFHDASQRWVANAVLAGVALVSKSQALRRASFVLTDVHAGDMHSSVSSLVVYETTPDGRCDVASRGAEGQRARGKPAGLVGSWLARVVVGSQAINSRSALTIAQVCAQVCTYVCLYRGQVYAGVRGTGQGSLSDVSLTLSSCPISHIVLYHIRFPQS